MRRFFVGTGGALAGAVLLSSLLTANGGGQEQQRLARLQGEARTRGGLAAAAAVTGSFSGIATYPGDGGPLNLDELVSISDIVVVGRLVLATPELIDEGRSIKTVFQVDVTESLKGHLEGVSVSVNLPGGRYQFENGSWAELVPRGFVPPKLHSRYAWFLRRNETASSTKSTADDGSKPYDLTSGPLGVYDLDNNSWIRPSGNYKSPLAIDLQHSRQSATTFVANVKHAIAR